MNPTISAFYQCYKQPKSFLRALKSFRDHYPTSDIFLTSDGGGYDYTQAAKTFNCTYAKLEQRTGELANSTVFSRREDFIQWLERLVEAAKKTTSEFILLLEDDVVVLKSISSPLVFDINGANTGEFLGKKIEEYLLSIGKQSPTENGRFYYGGCGGSLFKRTFLIEHFSDTKNIQNIIDELEPYREGRHLEIYSTDYWISLLTFYVNGTVGSYDGFCETWQSGLWFRKYIKKDIEVLHQAKDLYNKALSVQEKNILGEFIL